MKMNIGVNRANHRSYPKKEKFKIPELVDSLDWADKVIKAHEESFGATFEESVLVFLKSSETVLQNPELFKRFFLFLQTGNLRYFNILMEKIIEEKNTKPQ